MRHYNNKNIHRNKNSMNYKPYVNNNINKNDVKTMATRTTTISFKLPRKFKRTLSTPMSAATMLAEVEKLTTLAIDITENYQQYNNQKQQQQYGDKLNLSEKSANSDLHSEEYSTKRQIDTVTTQSRTSTTTGESREHTLIKNRKKAIDSTSSSLETDKTSIVNLVDIKPTTSATVSRTAKNQIDDVIGYNIDNIEKFLQQLEININTELILAKRRRPQQQQTTMTAGQRPKTTTIREELIETKNENIICGSINKTTGNNVFDIITTNTAKIFNNKHLNNDTSTEFAYDSLTMSCPCCTSSASTTTSMKFMYKLPDDYLLHDIW